MLDRCIKGILLEHNGLFYPLLQIFIMLKMDTKFAKALT